MTLEIPTTRLRQQVLQKNLELMAGHRHQAMRRLAPLIGGIAADFEEFALARGAGAAWAAFHEIGKHKDIYNKTVERIVGKGWDEEKEEVRDALAARNGFESWRKMEAYVLLAQFSRQVLEAEGAKGGLVALQHYAYGIDEKGRYTPHLDPMLEMPYLYLKGQMQKSGPYSYAYGVIGRIRKHRHARDPGMDEGFVLLGDELGHFLHDTYVLSEARMLAMPGSAKDALLDNLMDLRWRDAPADPYAAAMEVDRAGVAKELIAKLWNAGMKTGLSRGQSTDYATIVSGLIGMVERVLRDIDARHLFLAADFSGLIVDVVGAKVLGKGRLIGESDKDYDALNKKKWKIIMASYTPHIGIGALPRDVTEAIRRTGRRRALYPGRPEKMGEGENIWRTGKDGLRLEHHPWLAAKMLDSVFIRTEVDALGKTHVPIIVALQSHEGSHGYPYGSQKKDICADIVGIAKYLSMLVVPDVHGVSHTLDAALLALDRTGGRLFSRYAADIVSDMLRNNRDVRKRAKDTIAFYGL